MVTPEMVGEGSPPQPNSGNAVRLVLFAACPMHRMTPLYRLLAADPRLDFSVLYASDAGVRAAPAGYGTPIAWDVDLEFGYRHSYLKQFHNNSPVDGGFFSLRDTDVVRKLRAFKPDVAWMLGFGMFRTFSPHSPCEYPPYQSCTRTTRRCYTVGLYGSRLSKILFCASCFIDKGRST